MLEGRVHGESGRGCVCGRNCVSTKEKKRKGSGLGTEKAAARPEAEQVKEEGMSDEIVREFLLESNENLDQLDRELVSLEKDPRNRETLSSIFRTIHTIKGTCGFLAFGKLESVAHAGESLLSLLRDGTIELTPERTTALLSLVDAVRQMLGSIETSGNEGERNDAELVETLKRLQKYGEEKEAKEVKEVKDEEKREEATVEKPVQAEGVETAEKSAEEPGPPMQLGKILVEMGTVTPEDVAYAVQRQLEGDKRSIGEILVERGMLKSQDPDGSGAGATGGEEPGERIFDSRGCGAAGPADEPGGRAGAGAEPDFAAHAGRTGHGAGGERTAAEPDYFGTARRGDEDADATDWKHLEQVSADGARRGDELRQRSADRDGRERDGARQDDHRGDQGSADAPGEEFGGPRN